MSRVKIFLFSLGRLFLSERSDLKDIFCFDPLRQRQIGGDSCL